MRCPRLDELPPPPPGRSGWPWTEECPTLEPSTDLPRISLVTATYRRADYLEETIRSILLQGYPDLEYFVIDGQSEDGTVEILERYDRWLAGWVSEPDRGQSHALNKGLERVTGEIATYVSSDDFYLPGTLADVGAHGLRLRKGGYGAVVGGFRHIDEASTFTGAPIPSRLPGEGPHDLSRTPPESWRLHQEATFYTRAALDKVGRKVREDLFYNADRELLIRIAREFKIALSERCYAAFRIHQESGTFNDQGRCEAHFEYARLFESYASIRDGHEKERRRVARYYRAKALLTFAKYSGRRLASAGALCRALWGRPRILLNPAYARAWLGLLGSRRARATSSGAQGS